MQSQWTPQVVELALDPEMARLFASELTRIGAALRERILADADASEQERSLMLEAAARFDADVLRKMASVEACRAALGGSTTGHLN